MKKVVTLLIRVTIEMRQAALPYASCTQLRKSKLFARRISNCSA